MPMDPKPVGALATGATGKIAAVELWSNEATFMLEPTNSLFLRAEKTSAADLSDSSDSSDTSSPAELAFIEE